MFLLFLNSISFIFTWIDWLVFKLHQICWKIARRWFINMMFHSIVGPVQWTTVAILRQERSPETSQHEAISGYSACCELPPLNSSSKQKQTFAKCMSTDLHILSCCGNVERRQNVWIMSGRSITESMTDWKNAWMRSMYEWLNESIKAVLVNRVYRTPQGVPEFSRGVPTWWGVPDVCSSRTVTLSHICLLLKRRCANFSQILKPHLSGGVHCLSFPPVCL